MTRLWFFGTNVCCVSTLCLTVKEKRRIYLGKWFENRREERRKANGRKIQKKQHTPFEESRSPAAAAAATTRALQSSLCVYFFLLVERLNEKSSQLAKKKERRERKEESERLLSWRKGVMNVSESDGNDDRFERLKHHVNRSPQKQNVEKFETSTFTWLVKYTKSCEIDLKYLKHLMSSLFMNY